MRDAISRALAASLTGTELKVLLAIIQLVPMFDRLEDRIANAQLTTATGVDGRHVRRALGRLHNLGVIHREPGVGHKASLIRLSTEGADLALSHGAEGAPAEGADPMHGRGQIPPSRGGGHAPASEYPRDISEQQRSSPGGEPRCPSCESTDGRHGVVLDTDGKATPCPKRTAA